MTLGELKQKLIGGDMSFTNKIDFTTLSQLYGESKAGPSGATGSSEGGGGMVGMTSGSAPQSGNDPLAKLYDKVDPKKLGIDPASLPPELQGLASTMADLAGKYGGDIIAYSTNKLNVDRSFEDPKKIFNMDLSQLDANQKAAYYMDLLRAKQVNDFLDQHYGDVLGARNETTGKDVGRPSSEPSGRGATDIVGSYIDWTLKKMETPDIPEGGVKNTLMGYINDNMGNYLADLHLTPDNLNDPRVAEAMGAYTKLKNDYARALANDGQAFAAQATTADPTLGLKGLNTAALMAKTMLSEQDFEAQAGNFSSAYNGAMGSMIAHGLGAYGDDVIPGARDQRQPPKDLASFEAWQSALTDDSRSKMIRPTLEAGFDNSDVAQKLKDQGVKSGDAAWEAFKRVWVKDATGTVNTLVGNVRKDVKLQPLFAGAVTTDGTDLLRDLRQAGFSGDPGALGIDGKMLQAGALHTAQSAVLGASLAGTVMASAGDGKISPQEAMAITYGATGLGGMLAETAMKYINPKDGGLRTLGWASEQQLKDFNNKYLGGKASMVEGYSKLIAGAGSLIASAGGMWKAIQGIQNHDPVSAIANFAGAGGNMAAALSGGMEGALQAQLVSAETLGKLLARNVSYPSAGSAADLKAFENMVRGKLGVVGLMGGLVAGLGGTALGIVDFAKQVKAYDKGLQDADQYILPTTGWHYYDTWAPDPGIGIPN